MSDLTSDLDLALSLASRADAITLARFGALDLQVTDKPDLTPVSDADLATERELRAALASARPADALLGEEFGGSVEFTGRQWVVDPIDGTKNFVRGLPVWATLIALLEDGVPVVGVVSAPALARRWWASAGGGAYSSFDNGPARRISVSGVSTLSAASVSCLFPVSWPAALRPGLDALIAGSWRVRDYSDFLPYCFVAEGSLDVAAEPEISLWDVAALDILVREAGGTVTSLTGTPGPHGGNILATNGVLHTSVQRELAAGLSQ